MLSAETLLVFADDWGVHPSSAQHLLCRFLAQNRVIWVNTVGLRLPRSNLRDARKILGKLRHWFGPSGVASAPRVLSPEIHELPLAPLALGLTARRLNAWLLRKTVIRMLARRASEGNDAPRSRVGLTSSPFIISTLPLTADLADAVPRATFVYYLVDDYASWPGLGGRLVREMDQAQAGAADLIVAASQTLADLHRSRARRPVEYLPHGVDLDHFAQARTWRKNKAQMTKDGADVVFFGALDERIDRPLLGSLVRARPDLRFLLIGPGLAPSGAEMKAANVEQRAAAAYQDLPTILSDCKVALLPYVRGPFGDRLSPLKAREALAAGLPVVATDVPELRTLTRGVYLGRTLDEMLAALARALAAPEAVPAIEELVADSWEERAERFSEMLLAAQAARRPV